VEEDGLKFMADDKQTKICPSCAETIKMAAKVCPYCQTRQNRFRLLAGELTGVVAVLLVMVGLPILCEYLSPDDSDETSSLGFIIHRSDLSVAHLNLEASGKNNNDYWLTGLVTNNGHQAWRVHSFEVRILDDKNNLRDVAHTYLDKLEVFVVQPGQEHAFKVKFTTPMVDTSSKLSVRVQQATDGRERYNPSD
jgi:hypothetical protein